MSAAMYPGDPRAADDGPDDLPPLPIPRPGEWTPANSTPATPSGISPKPVGGGSFTSVEPGAGRRTGDAHAADPRGRLAWEVAAQLTSGMLANPAHSHSSVKDAMALFDQFLNEMHAYARIADAAAMGESGEDRRRARSEYFRAAEHPDDATARSSRASKPKPTPARPRPAADYRAIPPGTRAPYAANADSDDESSRGDGRAA